MDGLHGPDTFKLVGDAEARASWKGLDWNDRRRAT